MRATRRTLPVLIAVLSWSLAAPADDPARPFRTGRPLAEALEDLRSLGLDVIYSSDLVRPEMRVLAEPVASTPRGILEDLISPHGLEARDGPGGTVLIVKGEAAEGPAGGITGRVVSGSDRRPARGALVSIPGKGISIVTAPDGRFLLPRLPPGLWPLEIRTADGGMHQIVLVPVEAGKVTKIAIEVMPVPALIEEIIVTPTRHRMIGEQPEVRRSLQGEDLARMAHLGGDAHRAAARLPGTASGDKSARFSLRGGEWNEVLVVLDGLEIDQPFHLKDFLGFSGIFDSQAIDRIDLLMGGFPVEYGGRMGGVMEITSSVPAEQPSASLSTGFPVSRILAEGRTGGNEERWLVAARAWYPDAAADLVDPGGEDLNPYYYDLLGKIEFQRPSGTTVSGHVLASRDLVDFQGDEPGRAARALYDTAYAWLNISKPWTARLLSMTQVSAAATVSERRGAAEDPFGGTARVDDERASGHVGARQDWVFRGSERYLLKWGFDASAVRAEYESSARIAIDDPLFAPPGSPIILDRRISSRPSGRCLGAYAAARVRLLPSLTAEVGLRWDQRTYSGDAHEDPRMNLVWAVGERSTVRAAWGLARQPQRIDELQVEDGVREFLPSQRAEHRSISLQHLFDSGLLIRAEAYWKAVSRLRPRFENLFDPITLFPEGSSDRVRIAAQRARAAGLEFFLAREPSRAIRWWAGYALSRAEDEIDGTWEPRSWDQRHAFDVGLGCKFGRGWEIDLAGAWHSGWPTTRVDADAVIDPNGTVAIRPTLGARNAERFPPYHRVDMRLTRRFSLPANTLTLFLEVLNIYDRGNVCCVEGFKYVPEPGGRVLVERREGHWLGRVPSAGIAWRF